MQLKDLWVTGLRERVAQWDEKVDEKGEPLITNELRAKFMWIMENKPERLLEMFAALQGGYSHSENYDDDGEDEPPYQHPPTERSAQILQSFPPEILNLITKDLDFEDLYPLRLTTKYFRTTIPGRNPNWRVCLMNRLWNYRARESMVTQHEIDLSWLARKNKRLVCNCCFHFLPESKFDAANKTAMKKRGGFRAWYRNCIDCEGQDNPLHESGAYF